MKCASHVILAVWVLYGALLPAQTTPTSDERNSEQTAADSKSQPSSRSVEILSDTMGVDFGPYVTNVQKAIREKWYSLIPDVARPPVKKRGKVSIEFSILKDGRVSGMKILMPSGDVSLDRAAWDGIKASDPFLPLPKEFNGNDLRLRILFYYNLKPPNMDDAIEIVHAIQRKEIRSKDDLPDLQLAIANLTATLDADQLDKSDAAVVHYYRALARALINYTHEHEGEAVDLSLANEALADFDQAIAGSADFYERGFSKANAEYQAGLVARNQIHSEPLAYSYWKKCAEEKHPGCLNIMATARVTGKGGQSVDFRQALELHDEVFKTGIRARCAGSFSARSIAAIGYFTGIKRPDDDELAWMNRAYALLDQLEAQEGTHSSQVVSDVCHRSRAEIEEFLYRLSRGDRQDDILKKALKRPGDDPVAQPVLEYLLDSIGAEKLETTVASIKSEGDRCTAYFYTMWYAELTNKHTAGERLYKHLSDIGEFFCATDLVYAKKFGFGSNPGEARPDHSPSR